MTIRQSSLSLFLSVRFCMATFTIVYFVIWQFVLHRKISLLSNPSLSLSGATKKVSRNQPLLQLYLKNETNSISVHHDAKLRKTQSTNSNDEANDTPRVKETNDILKSTFVPEELMNNKPYIESLQYYNVQVRAYEWWPSNRKLPCFPPLNNNNNNNKSNNNNKPSISQETPYRGFLFMKLMKCGGSTAAGIHLRILQRVALEFHNNNITSTTPNFEDNNRKEESRILSPNSGRTRQQLLSPAFQFCGGRWDHTWGYDIIRNRVPNDNYEAFTWTIVREPTSRAISQFFHFMVSRENISATDDIYFQNYLLRETNSFFLYYLRVLSSQVLDIEPMSDDEASTIVNDIILKEYNFIGITERMDESVVALMMLLNLKMGSILYLNSKGSGGYDDGAYNGCQYIQPSFISSKMKDFFNSSQWKNYIKWDVIFYKAVNRSLDITINKRLGRKEFEIQLAKFRAAQKIVTERCSKLEVFPCTSTGKRNKKKSCLWKDSGCGYKCLDKVATDLNLWE